MTAFRHLLLRTTGTGHCTRNAPGTSLAHASPGRIDAFKKTHTVSCADPEAGAVGMHPAVQHTVVTLVGCPRAGSTKFLSWRRRISYPLVFACRRRSNVSMFQGSVFDDLIAAPRNG